MNESAPKLYERINCTPWSDISRQVEAAKKKLDAWPDWMKKQGRFEGTDAELAAGCYTHDYGDG